MANDRDLVRHIADMHAARDWKKGKRWSCTCHPCEQARADKYEPKSTIDAMNAKGEAR